MTNGTHATPHALIGYADKTVFVVGLGRSGMSAARALTAGGADVLCWDDGDAARIRATDEGFKIENPVGSARLSESDALVLAPGIPLTHPTPHPAVMAAKDADVPVIGDIDLLFDAAPNATFVGITGTNGKSTTTALIGHVLRDVGLDVAVGGNLGTPALDLPEADIYVLEMSSYQLDLARTTRFDISILLNITPDHLDRHGGMDGYVAAKKRILRPRDENSLAIICTDQDITADIANQAMVDGSNITRISKDTDPTAQLIDREALPALIGDHGKQNAAAAFTVSNALGVDRDRAIAALETFPGLAHRQERIATLDGILFVNDSKATNPDSATRALGAYRNSYWIAGGRAKDGGFGVLDDYLGRVRHAFLIGEATDALDGWIAGRVRVTRSGTMDRAVQDAFRMAVSDTDPGPVILSPACASFDQYANFEKRGDAFREAVLSLPCGVRTVFTGQEAA
ncbi:MAG: UDP-N-acetylmuramoyl-L-alanine--D-glutamate ligase [Alphaproteobacteria bacterium]